ncbi:MAG: YeeE/YedE family protein [Rhodospirillales bacterium]
MENFTPYSALIGGVIIGIAAAILLWLNGQVAGISGIAGGILDFERGDLNWRLYFVAGLIGGVALYRLAGGPLQDIEISTSVPLLVAGGLLTGIGTRLGGGCTSGHGVCGIARLSTRSIAATVIFMVVAGLTVFTTNHILGAGT